MPLPIPLDKAENREEVAAYEEREQKRQRTELEKVSSFVQRCLSSKSHQPGRVCYVPLSCRRAQMKTIPSLYGHACVSRVRTMLDPRLLFRLQPWLTDDPLTCFTQPACSNLLRQLQLRTCTALRPSERRHFTRPQDS